MRLAATALVLAALAALAAVPGAAAPQDGTPEADPAAAPAGWPVDASPAARERFERLRAALGLTAPEAPTGPIGAFDVRFELLSRLGDQTNEFRAAVQYLAPRFVRVDPEGAATFGQGPNGSWLSDRGEVVLTQGREYAEDLRQLRQAIVLCQHFAGLGDVDGLRITRAEALEQAPAGLPKHRVERAVVPRKLDWLELETTDLDLFAEADAAAAPRRGPPEEPVPSTARFGLDPESGELRALHVRRPAKRPGRSTPERYVVFEAWTTLDGRRVPSRFFVYDKDPSIDPSTEGLQRFGEQPNQEVFLLAGRLDVELAPESFDPPTPADD